MGAKTFIQKTKKGDALFVYAILTLDLRTQAMGIVYPQHWIQLECETSFVKHLEVLKVWYCEPKIMGSGESRFVVLALLNHW